jgi:hypothetical protein
VTPDRDMMTMLTILDNAVGFSRTHKLGFRAGLAVALAVRHTVLYSLRKRSSSTLLMMYRRYWLVRDLQDTWHAALIPMHTCKESHAGCSSSAHAHTSMSMLP